MIKKTLFIMLAWVMFALPALAEEKPADSMIASVQGDLSRYEPMVANMSPGDRSGARISRFVPVMESRLGSSRHQKSASWLETSHRLKVLKQALIDIKEGKKPSFPTVAKTASPRTSEHSSASIQTSMSDPDRARKIDALNSGFVQDINRMQSEDFAKANVIHDFKTKIAAMQALSAGFQDNSLGYVQQVNGAIVEADQYLQKRIAAAEATAKNTHQVSASTSVQNSMSDRDRAMKIEKLRSTFYEDFNRAGAKDLGKAKVVNDFSKRIEVMQTMASGFQDNSIGFVRQVKGFVVEAEVYFKKRTAKALAMLKRNEQRRSSLHARNDRIEATNKTEAERIRSLNKQSQDAMTAQNNRGQADYDAAAQGQSERTIAALHRQFSKVYSRVRGALPYLNAETLADTEEARDWINKVKAMKNIVNQYQDKNTAIAKKDIAIYEEVKRKVESGLAQNSAATGGLTTADLSRDHQALQELVVKYKPFFSKLDVNNTASLTKIEAFNQGSGKAEIETALASFARKYGNGRAAIAAKFELVNGGRVWRSSQRYVPESGFERLSEWMSALNAGQETALASKESNSGVKRLFAFPGGQQVDVKFPVLDIARTNRHFEKARNALDALLKKYPNREKARQSRDELDGIKQKFLDGMNKAIDDVRWGDREDQFVGPGDVDNIKEAAMHFLKLKGKVLAFGISSYEWYVNDEDIHGRPINYALTFKYAEKIKNKSDTAMIKQVALVTSGANRSLPFVKILAAGSHWEIRIKNLP